MAKISGHPVYFDEADQVWRWQDTRQVVNHERGCSVCGRALCMVRLARTTPRGFTEAGVDACLAPFVQALNNGGLQTIASCCGHGGGPATIILEDGREVLVLEAPAPGESFIRSTILAGHGPTLNKDSAIQTSGPDLRGALEKAAATLHDGVGA